MMNLFIPRLFVSKEQINKLLIIKRTMDVDPIFDVKIMCVKMPHLTTI